MLRGLGGLALILLAACAPDYVYIQAGKSEQDVRRDYIGCAEQQFKVSNNTTECMERQGYHVREGSPWTRFTRVPPITKERRRGACGPGKITFSPP